MPVCKCTVVLCSIKTYTYSYRGEEFRLGLGAFARCFCVGALNYRVCSHSVFAVGSPRIMSTHASYYAALRSDDPDDADSESQLQSPLEVSPSAVSHGAGDTVDGTVEEEFRFAHEWTLWFDDQPPKGTTKGTVH